MARARVSPTFAFFSLDMRRALQFDIRASQRGSRTAVAADRESVPLPVQIWCLQMHAKLMRSSYLGHRTKTLFPSSIKIDAIFPCSVPLHFPPKCQLLLWPKSGIALVHRSFETLLSAFVQRLAPKNLIAPLICTSIWKVLPRNLFVHVLFIFCLRRETGSVREAKREEKDGGAVGAVHQF